MKWNLSIRVCLLVMFLASTKAAVVSGYQNTQCRIFAAEVFAAVASDNLNNNVLTSPAAKQCSMEIANNGAMAKRTMDFWESFGLPKCGVYIRHGSFIPTIININSVPQNFVNSGTPTHNQPDIKPQNAVVNNPNNNHNNRSPPQMPSAPPQGSFVNRMNPAPGSYPPTANNHNNNQNKINHNKNIGSNNAGSSKEKLSTNLLQTIVAQVPYSNIVYSPLSLELLLTFVSLGARGRTANELTNALRLPANKQQIISQASAKIPPEQNSKGARLIMANKMYYANNLLPENNISDAAMMLQTEFETINFLQPDQAAANINGWVAWKTQNRIQSLISPQSLESDTESILINAIHFKAQWDKEFSTSDTEIRDFQNNDGQIVKVDMMYNEDRFRYGEFPSLGMKVVELPYNDSDISMMIILPDDTYGIKHVEKLMEKVDLADISNHLETKNINLRLPKFRFDCELDMVPPLMQLGIQELFSNNADLSGFFRDKLAKVSRIKTKAFLEVNEAGSEAAVASYYKLVQLSLPSGVIQFNVDHPFMFAIRSANSVYFLGHVVKL